MIAKQFRDTPAERSPTGFSYAYIGERAIRSRLYRLRREFTAPGPFRPYPNACATASDLVVPLITSTLPTPSDELPDDRLGAFPRLGVFCKRTHCCRDTAPQRAGTPLSNVPTTTTNVHLEASGHLNGRRCVLAAAFAADIRR